MEDLKTSQTTCNTYMDLFYKPNPRYKHTYAYAYINAQRERERDLYSFC